MNKAGVIFVFSLLLKAVALAQYAPAAGQPGTTAVHKDSVAIVSWANSVVQFERGASDIANGWSSLASFGDSTQAIGYAQGSSTNVVSLGDSGSITLAFPFPIMNGPGNDFAVFENSFSDEYLEFAFVEVSSDGIHFVRFPSVSLIQSIIQTGPYENSDTELIHNLAGKYRQGYGTPFDLQDLIDSAGINLDSVLYVKVVDVIGTINTSFCSYDSQGNRINDPYPTDFAAGGFDLDGVGVMNENNIYASIDEVQPMEVVIYPNPSNGKFYLNRSGEKIKISVFDLSGKFYFTELVSGNEWIDFSNQLSKGVYLMRVESENKIGFCRVVIQ
jgi:hypothetical protein